MNGSCFFLIKIYSYVAQDFPGGPGDKNPPANAEDTGWIPDPGRFHMPRSNYTRAPQLSLSSATREAAATRSLSTALKNSPCSGQEESATETQHSQKIKMKNEKTNDIVKQLYYIKNKIKQYNFFNVAQADLTCF